MRDKKFIRKHAEKFDNNIFVKELKSFVEKEYNKFKNNANTK